MIKVVMSVIMMTVLISRALVIPVYLSELNLIATLAPETAKLLKNVSFGVMVVALLLGAGIVLRALLQGMREHKRQHAVLEEATATD